MKKRTLSIILILCMMLTMLPVTALAASDTSCDGGESCKHEAAIGNTHYDTLSEAIEAAKSGEEVDLLKDVDVSTTGLQIGSDITLDLNGHAIKAASTENGKIKISGNVTLQDDTDTNKDGSGKGKIYTETKYTGSATGHAMVEVLPGGSLVMESGYLDAASFTNDPANEGQFAIGVTGGDKGASVTMNGGKVEAGWYAISGNGSKLEEDTTVVVNGGELISVADYAIYQPQLGSVEIKGGVVYGAAGGVAMNRGNLIVSGGVITSKGQGDTGDWGDGTGGLDNAAVNVSAKYDDVAVTISGGEFVAAGDAVTIEKGTTHTAEIAISGGTFSSDVSEYITADSGITKNEDGKWVVASLGQQNAAAEANNTYYKTLQEAVEKNNNTTVKLLQDVKENITIAEGKTLTLDLNGKTITETSAMVVEGTLTIEDSTATEAPAVSGDYNKVTYEAGMIQNTADGIVVRNGGKLTVNGGIIHSTANNAVSINGSDTAAGWETPIESQATINGGYLHSREYGIGVYGNGAVLNVEGGVIVADDNAAVAGNGSKTASQNFGGTTINISGGTLIGHIITEGYIAVGIYHPQSGELNITGGTIYADNGVGICIRNGALNISDDATIIATGTEAGKVGDAANQIPGKAVVVDYAKGYNHNNDEKDTRTVSISGGTFKAEQDAVEVYTAEGNKVVEKFITGGHFTSDPSAYLADQYLAVGSNEAGCKYTVEKKTETEVPVEAAVEAPVVNDKNLPSDMTPEDKEAVTNAAKTVNVPELGAYGNSVANQVTDEQATAAADKLKDAGLAEAEQQVKVYVQTYLDVQPTGYDAEKKELTVNITPMYKTVSSTADKAEDVKLDGDGKNAVVYDEGELKVAGAVEVTMTLPAGFAADDANLYVMHEAQSGTYYYKATLSGNTLSFTNPHGFSTFTVKEDDRTAVVDYGEYAEDATYTAANVGEELPTADAPSGKRFSGWKFNGVAGTYTTLTDSLLTALDEAYTDKPIEATPVFSKRSNNGGTAYTVNVQAGKGGDVEVSPERASKSTTITVTVKADDGYSVDEVTVTESNGDKVDVKRTSESKYTFTMPASNVTVKATFTKGDAPEIPFKDVAENAWYYEAVKYAYDNDIMNGVKNDTFAPNSNLNRAMIAQVLYNLEGEPSVKGDAFSDVAEDAWYFDAVNWAAENKIVEGYGDGNFGPTKAVTREQLAAILFRYAQYKGMDSVTLEENLTGFADGDQVSSWAVSAMNWAVGQGIMNGKGNNTLDPQGTATRAEVAKMLMVYLELK